MTAAEERREKIRAILAGAAGPVSASSLAGTLGVSRQIVVGDVALLRAAGEEIDATPRGYVVRRERTGYAGLLACRHTGQEQMRQELYAIVDNGGCAEDVRVENPLYGEITGRLMLASRYEVDNFIALAGREPEGLLSRMTGGVHLHRVVCPDEESFRRIRTALREKGILYEKE